MLQIADCDKCKELGIETPQAPYIKCGNNKILVIGEFPKKDSRDFFYDQRNKIFKSAERLSEYLKIIGLDLASVSFTEMCKCTIDDRKKMRKTTENCYAYLEDQIEGLKPKLIITIGTTTKDVFSRKSRTDIEIGRIYKINNYSYLPLYHPSPANPTGHKKNLQIISDNKAQLLHILK